MRSILYALLCLLVAFTACDTSVQTAAASVGAAPRLLDRSEAIQAGKEWESVQNKYAAANANLIERPNDTRSLLDIAQVFIYEARVTGEHGHYYPAALEVVERALATMNGPHPDRFEALLIKASVQLSQHEFEEAKATATEAAALNQHNSYVHGALTDANVELGDYEQARVHADKMNAIRPDLRSYARVSYLREINGYVDEALEAMEMAAKAGMPGKEDTAWARHTLGDLYLTYGDLDRAAMNYQIAMQQRENYSFAMEGMAKVEMARTNYDDAEKLLKKAMGIIPEVGYYATLAGLYLETDRKPEADKLLEEIYVMLEDDVKSGHNMNMEYAYLHLDLTGDYAKALEYAELEYAERPDNIDVNKLMAIAHYHLGNYDKAKTFADAAARTSSQHPELLTVRGLAHLKAGDTTRGKEYLMASYRRNPFQSHSLSAAGKSALDN